MVEHRIEHDADTALMRLVHKTLHGVNRCYTNYMQQTNDVLFNMLDSHDTIRLRNVTSGLDMRTA